MASEARRIRAEFHDMPGLSLSVAQAARLWGWTPEHSAALLSQLADEKYLVRDSRGEYRVRGSQLSWGEYRERRSLCHN